MLNTVWVGGGGVDDLPFMNNDIFRRNIKSQLRTFIPGSGSLCPEKVTTDDDVNDVAGGAECRC